MQNFMMIELLRTESITSEYTCIRIYIRNIIKKSVFHKNKEYIHGLYSSE